MKLGDVIIAKTPCCGHKVRLTFDGETRWTRHCMGRGCRKIYDVELEAPLLAGDPDQAVTKLVWKERHRR